MEVPNGQVQRLGNLKSKEVRGSEFLGEIR